MRWSIFHALESAHYIQINNQFGRVEPLAYLIESLDQDDVAMQIELESGSLALTLGDLQSAIALPDGGFWLTQVGYLHFLSRENLH